MHPALQSRLRHPPWTFLCLAAAALLIQLNPVWRDRLLYDRPALVAGEA